MSHTKFEMPPKVKQPAETCVISKLGAKRAEVAFVSAQDAALLRG